MPPRERQKLQPRPGDYIQRGPWRPPEGPINPDDYITTSEHNQEYRELESRINDLTSIIENKQKQVNMFRRLYNKIKVLLSYSFKSKVGVK